MAVSWDVLDTIEASAPVVAEWDGLAERAELPYSAPAWLLSWWRHAAPEGARLRVVAVRDGGRLVGVGPFYAVPWAAGLWTYSLMGTDTTSRIEPLAAPAERHTIALAIAEALAAATPPVGRLLLEGLPSDSPWPDLLREAWPGRRRPWLHLRPPAEAPTVSLPSGSLDDWFAGRSSNFRQQMRRARRKLEKQGAVFRVSSTPEELDRDLVAFERLHNARWDWRGGSTALTPGTAQMLAEAGRELGPERFKLISLDLDGKTINSQLFVAAGGEISYWNGGFDEEFASLKPSLVGLVEALRISLEEGHKRLDLGPGAQAYKYRFSDGEDQLEWMTLVPPGRRYVRARLLYAPRQLRYAITGRLTPEQKERLRKATDRLRLR